MIQLYGIPLSTYCAKVRVVMRLKQIPFAELPPPDGYASAAYRAIIPMGTIPGFIDGTVVLSESEAIAEYLEERYPAPSILPGDHAARARIRSLSRIHDCWVEPHLRALYAHASPANRDDAIVADRVTQFWRRLSEFAQYATLAPFAAGSTFTLADCAWATTLIHAQNLLPHLGHPFRLPGPLNAWRTQLGAHDAVAPELARCTDGIQSWLATRA
jgi:glutathione S-transferase